MPENLRQLALNNATGRGQENQLRKLFERYPDCTYNYWAVVDFNKPSNENRLFIFDLQNKSVAEYLVTHGKNSGELYANSFSNQSKSNKSSLGVFQCAETYTGKHGNSLKLDGLDATNSNARARLVVIHKADYVVPNYEGTGRAGRSEGCFAVNPSVIEEVIKKLKNGSYLLAWHGEN